MNVTRLDLPMRRLASGHELSTPVLRLEDGRPGKKVYIQSGNHGGEVAGHGAIWELLGLLRDEELHGVLYLLPQVNPVSLDQRVGDWQVGVYDLFTGTNWNRVFKLLARDGGADDDPRVDVRSFARAHRDAPWADAKQAFKAALAAAVGGLRAALSSRGLDDRDAFALALQDIACDADIVLDLHTGDVAPRYLYAPPWRPAAHRALDISHVLWLDDRFAGAMDEATICPWLMLARAFAEVGRAVEPDVEGYTVELGGIETLSFPDMRADAARLANFLRAHDVLRRHPRRDAQIPRYGCAIGDYRSYAAPDAGLAVFEKGPGDRVYKGDVIARILAPSRLRSLDRSEAETPVISQDDGILVTRHASPVVFRGMVLCKLMTRIEEL